MRSALRCAAGTSLWADALALERAGLTTGARASKSLGPDRRARPEGQTPGSGPDIGVPASRDAEGVATSCIAARTAGALAGRSRQARCPAKRLAAGIDAASM